VSGPDWSGPPDSRNRRWAKNLNQGWLARCGVVEIPACRQAGFASLRSGFGPRLVGATGLQKSEMRPFVCVFSAWAWAS